MLPEEILLILYGVSGLRYPDKLARETAPSDIVAFVIIVCVICQPEKYHNI